MSLLDVELPKWPMMLLIGDAVSEQDALEVIRRTDAFFVSDYSGNNHQRIDKIKRTVGMPLLPRVITESMRSSIWEEYYAALDEWKKYWGALDLCYLQNEWVSTAYVNGPHGWMHPDGEVFYCDNVGKWPSPLELIVEWKTIAKAFPFLNLACVLMNLESTEENPKPLLGIKVHDGTAELVEPSDDLFAPFGFKTIEHLQCFAGGYMQGRDLYQCHRMLSSLGGMDLDMESSIYLTQIEIWATAYKEGKYNGLSDGSTED